MTNKLKKADKFRSVAGPDGVFNLPGALGAAFTKLGLNLDKELGFARAGNMVDAAAQQAEADKIARFKADEKEI